nr:carbohydrate binding domain-containing protein [Allomuricauda sp.]
MKSCKKILLIASVLYVNLSYSQELHTHSNVVSIASESNSTDGWTGSATRTADTTDPYHGTYAMKIVSTSNNTQNRRAQYTFPVINGETYNISIWAKVGAQTDDPAFASWQGFTGFSTTLISGTAWTEYSFTLTANSTSATIIAFTGSSTSSIGDEIYIDSVSITPQNPTDTQAPTAPTVTVTSTSDTTIDLAWSGATDNVGITGYKIFKDNILETTLGNVPAYQITGLLASTTYALKIRALDAAGNESPDSNVLSITTDGPGGGNSVWTDSNGVASYTGNVAIGRSTVPLGYKLAVEGQVRAREIRVDQDTWPDYVFEEGYHLPSLEEIQEYIKENGHLPNLPSREEVEANGVQLGEMNRLLLEKIEQLMLYTILQKEKLDLQQQKNRNMEKRLEQLEKRERQQKEIVIHEPR